MSWVRCCALYLSLLLCSSHWFPKTPSVLFYRIHHKSLRVSRALTCRPDALRCRARFPDRALCRLVLYREAGHAWVMPAGKVGSFRYCRCLPAWRGRACQQPVDPCTSASCGQQAGRICERAAQSATGFVCRCADGVGGADCGAAPRPARLAVRGACQGRPCGAGWHCREAAAAAAGYTCDCHRRPGYRPASDTDPTCVVWDACAALRPCRHGGTCLPLPGAEFRCQCGPAWSGHSCQLPLSPCDQLADLCAGDWKCRRDARAAAGYSCGCDEKPGWAPRSSDDPQCVIRDTCAAQRPCLHGGTCTPGPGDGFTCQCVAAWTGGTCTEPRDPCAAGNPCGETWKCRRDPDGAAGFRCDCESRPGWAPTSLGDPRCVVADHCMADNPCEHGGTCRYLSPGAFACQCRPAWTGRTCHVPRDPCGGADTCGAGWPCRRDAAAELGYTCGCEQRPGWRAVSSKDPTCILVEHCKAKMPCSHGGTCLPTMENGVSGFTCRCAPAWGGPTCTETRNPCAAGDAACGVGWSCRRDAGSRVGFSCGCSRRRGWKARSLDDPRCVRSDLCRLQRPCRNGGVCGPGARSQPFSCRCPAAWQGPLCTRPRNPCHVGSPCGEKDRCARKASSRAGYTCHCELRPGYRPHSPSNPRCVLNDACRALTPCLHGGTCSATGRGHHGFSCLCARAWDGERCEVARDPCTLDQKAVATACGGGGGGGVCVRDPTSEAGFDCDCESRPGWRRRSSADPGCVVQDACVALRPCRHGATCRNVVDPATGRFYRCFCHPAWKGDNCTAVRDPCVEPANACNVGFRCRRDVDSRLGFSCGCDEKPGYRPSSPANPECEVYDTCLAREPCANGGECFPIGEKSFFCECKKGWTGKTCEVVHEPCQGMQHPCGARWRCHIDRRLTLGYTCGCTNKPGWAASSVDGRCVVADPCLAFAPCLNGGSCSAAGGGDQYTCACRPGWAGATCEAPLDPCDEGRPCGARFPCRRDVHSDVGFSCDCGVVPGFRPAGDDDPRCELDDVCLAEPPCLFGGRCVALGGANFSCACAPGRRGRLCEQAVTTPLVNVTLAPPPPAMVPDENESLTARPDQDQADEDEPMPLLQSPKQFQPLPPQTPTLDGFRHFSDELSVLMPKLKLIFIPLGVVLGALLLVLLCVLSWRRVRRRRRDQSDRRLSELDRTCEQYIRAKYGCEREPASPPPPPCEPLLPPCPPPDPCGLYGPGLGPEYFYYDPCEAEDGYWAAGEPEPYRTPPEYVPDSDDSVTGTLAGLEASLRGAAGRLSSLYRRMRRGRSPPRRRRRRAGGGGSRSSPERRRHGGRGSPSPERRQAGRGGSQSSPERRRAGRGGSRSSPERRRAGGGGSSSPGVGRWRAAAASRDRLASSGVSSMSEAEDAALLDGVYRVERPVGPQRARPGHRSPGYQYRSQWPAEAFSSSGESIRLSGRGGPFSGGRAPYDAHHRPRSREAPAAEQMLLDERGNLRRMPWGSQSHEKYPVQLQQHPHRWPGWRTQPDRNGGSPRQTVSLETMEGRRSYSQDMGWSDAREMPAAAAPIANNSLHPYNRDGRSGRRSPRRSRHDSQLRRLDWDGRTDSEILLAHWEEAELADAANAVSAPRRSADEVYKSRWRPVGGASLAERGSTDHLIVELTDGDSPKTELSSRRMVDEPGKAAGSAPSEGEVGDGGEIFTEEFSESTEREPTELRGKSLQVDNRLVNAAEKITTKREMYRKSLEDDGSLVDAVENSKGKRESRGKSLEDDDGLVDAAAEKNETSAQPGSDRDGVYLDHMDDDGKKVNTASSDERKSVVDSSRSDQAPIHDRNRRHSGSKSSSLAGSAAERPPAAPRRSRSLAGKPSDPSSTPTDAGGGGASHQLRGSVSAATLGSGGAGGDLAAGSAADYRASGADATRPPRGGHDRRHRLWPPRRRTAALPPDPEQQDGDDRYDF